MMKPPMNQYTIRDAHGNGCKRFTAHNDSRATARLAEWIVGKMEPDQFYVTREFPKEDTDGII